MNTFFYAIINAQRVILCIFVTNQMLMNKFFTLICIVGISLQDTHSQELYVGNNAEFYLGKEMPFTTSSTIVTLGTTGIFSVEAGTDWGSLSEYVNGKVIAYGGGNTKLPTGNSSVYAAVIANHTGNIEASYFNTTPATGSNGADVDAVSTTEYWELIGNAVITLPWNANSSITALVNDNGGVLNSVAIVGNNGGVWDLVSAPNTNTVTGSLTEGTTTSDATNAIDLNGFSQFTFGIDHQAVLGIDDLFLTTNINIISNPIASGENIKFRSSADFLGLQISLYDLSGRQLQLYKNIVSNNGLGILQKPNVPSGIYILRFEQEGKKGIKKIIIE